MYYADLNLMLLCLYQLHYYFCCYRGRDQWWDILMAMISMIVVIVAAVAVDALVMIVMKVVLMMLMAMMMMVTI